MFPLIFFGCRLWLRRFRIRCGELRTGPLPHVRRLVGRRRRGWPMRVRFHLPKRAQHSSKSSIRELYHRGGEKKSIFFPRNCCWVILKHHNFFIRNNWIAAVKKAKQRSLFNKRACVYWTSLCEAFLKSASWKAMTSKLLLFIVSLRE